MTPAPVATLVVALSKAITHTLRSQSTPDTTVDEAVFALAGALFLTFKMIEGSDPQALFAKFVQDYTTLHTNEATFPQQAFEKTLMHPKRPL